MEVECGRTEWRAQVWHTSCLAMPWAAPFLPPPTIAGIASWDEYCRGLTVPVAPTTSWAEGGGAGRGREGGRGE